MYIKLHNPQIVCMAEKSDLSVIILPDQYLHVLVSDSVCGPVVW